MNDFKQKAQELGIVPKNFKGQNFLIDENALAKIIKAADIKKSDRILEIGPGFGVLTKELLNKGANVLAVEMDSKLALHLKSEFGDNPNLQILEKDILKVPNQEIHDLLGGDFRVISNIPYQITGKIIKKLVSSELPKPKHAVLLVQKEVAERVCVDKGKMNLLGLSVQLYANPKIAFFIDKGAFWPQPKVNSAVLVISNVREKPQYDVDEKNFWQAARIGFSCPRKQLRNNLANGFHINQKIIKHALNSAGLNESARAQELDVEDWIKLISALDKN